MVKLTFDQMVAVGPVYVHNTPRGFRCVWTPINPDGGFSCHGIGENSNVYAAMGAAQKHAAEQGWKAPEPAPV